LLDTNARRPPPQQRTPRRIPGVAFTGQRCAADKAEARASPRRSGAVSSLPGSAYFGEAEELDLQRQRCSRAARNAARTPARPSVIQIVGRVFGIAAPAATAAAAGVGVTAAARLDPAGVAAPKVHLITAVRPVAPRSSSVAHHEGAASRKFSEDRRSEESDEGCERKDHRQSAREPKTRRHWLRRHLWLLARGRGRAGRTFRPDGNNLIYCPPALIPSLPPFSRFLCGAD